MSAARAVLAVGAARLLAYPLYGYAIGMHNHSIQIPLVRHLQDPKLFPSDLFVATLDNYTSFLWPTMAWATQYVSMDVAFATGHFLAELVLLGGVFALAAATFRETRWAPYAALWSVLWANPHIGGESIHWFYFTHTQVAAAIAVWCLALAARGAWKAAFLLTGLVFNIHAMEAVYIGVMLGLATLTEPHLMVRRLLGGGIVAALAATPGLYWLSSSGALGSPPDLAALLRAFFPEHFYISAFTAAQWKMLAVVVIVLVIASLGVKKTDGAKRLLAMIAGAVVLLVFGAVASELRPTPTLLKLHVLRAIPTLIVLTLVLASGWLAALAEEREQPLSAIAFLMIVVTVPLGIGLDSLDFDSPLHRGVAGMAVASGIAALLLLLKGRTAGGVSVALMAFVVAFACILPTREIAPLQGEAKRNDWVATQHWARENTPIDARFFTPPMVHGFRTFSERSVAAEWLDGSATMFDAEYASYWRAWYLDMGGQFADAYERRIWDRLGAVYAERSLADLTLLARKYDADYMVVPRGRLDSSPDSTPLYRNGSYAVIAIPPEPRAE
jgi:hypothetical protein